MIELLILYKLSKKVLTMYGLSRDILNDFAIITKPSFGTIKPALNRLEKSGFIRAQKTMSSGGRPSIYYSVTENGIAELKRLMVSSLPENPTQYLTSARIRIACSEILETNEKLELFKSLENVANNILYEAIKVQKRENISFYHKMVTENIICEYKNLILLLEGFKNACKN